MNAESPFLLPSHWSTAEPLLSFHPDRSDFTSTHPLIGLSRFGPFSGKTLGQVSDPIRIAFIYPNGKKARVSSLLREFEQRSLPRERRQYLTEFAGFSRMFGVRMVEAGDAHVELSRDLNDKLRHAEKPHVVLAEAITSAMNRVQLQRHSFDVLAILLDDEWESGFEDHDEGFDLHDYLKAITAARGTPSQLLIESEVFGYNCRASVMWRLGIAFYTKAGGIPWKLVHTDTNSAFVGLSYALRINEEGNAEFITCCSQVFDADGSGLEFIAYKTKDFEVVRENPYLSRNEMRRVMARSLALYQQRHAGRIPKRIVLHKTTPFKGYEIDGAFDAFTGAESVELYQVQQDVSWSGILIDAPRDGRSKGQPSAYPIERGTSLQLGDRELLLWVQGDAPTAVGGTHFFKEGKGIPRPLLLKRFAGQNGWDAPIRDVLGLSKMNWNNDSLYDSVPVTMGFAATLARIVKRMPTIGERPYEFRLFM